MLRDQYWHIIVGVVLCQDLEWAYKDARSLICLESTEWDLDIEYTSSGDLSKVNIVLVLRYSLIFTFVC